MKNVNKMEKSKIVRKNRFSLEVTKGKEIKVNVLDEASGRNGSYSFNHTRHSLTRSEQRGIDNMVISMVIEFGKLFQKQGLQYYALGSHNAIYGFEHRIKERAKNTVVVIGEGGQIVTCYRGNKVIRHIKRKQNYLSAA